ncbi:hypothetical protein P3T36_004844 [Kitasatospora sp. MAP12-15]|uniref:hypothetical protein n=1 Tax=unclassified Kitasatospora TaxID=2633591 RepID=UPI0024771AF9|nr:hypothetical protein [Kitasatospora sp. MAP12-44]MDH6110224.1 hypothetical protein [Kitasatospora sp. MAP12-44]
MPKKGAVLPWRLSYEWENGVKSTTACYTQDEAERERGKLFDTDVSRDLDVTVTIVNRLTGEEVPLPPLCARTCGRYATRETALIEPGDVREPVCSEHYQEWLDSRD